MRKRVILESFQNVGWALVFAVAIWLVMAQSAQKEAKVTALFIVTPPPGGVNVQYQAPYDKIEQRKVELTVRGAASDLEHTARAGAIQGTFPVPDKWPMGPHKIPLRNFKFDPGPGVEVDLTSLNQEVEIVLDQEKRHPLLLELDLDQTLPDGWMFEKDGEPALEPRELAASGPIAKMNQDPQPKVRTEPLTLEKVLQRSDFDRKSRDPRSFEHVVSIIEPAEIRVEQKKTVKLRFSIRLKPLAVDIELTPAIQFPGPGFKGLPYKLVPFVGQDRIKVKVSGPEIDLLDKTIEKTKEKFTVFVTPRPEFFEKGSARDYVNCDVVIIPPPGIQVISEPDPKLYRFDKKPLDPEEK